MTDQKNLQGNKKILHTVTLDDDALIGKLIEGILKTKTFVFDSASKLLKNARFLNPTAIFVDVHLAHDENGLDVIPKLRSLWPDSPIIVITGGHEKEIISEALASGAHDFIFKPIEPEELKARLNARIGELHSKLQNQQIPYGDITVQVAHRCIKGPKGVRYLSPREIDIIKFLIEQDGIIASKSVVKRKIWGGIAVSNNAIDRKIYEVRKAISEISKSVAIKTIYGQGIVLRYQSFDDDQLLLEDKQYEIDRSLATPN